MRRGSRPVGASATSRGRQAEALVAEYLWARGTSILRQNMRLGALEVDIVARTGGTLLLVEVRSRAERALVPALSSIGQQKKTRILRAADQLWQCFSSDPSIERMRIDVACVCWSHPPRVDYFPGAIVRA